jgi:septal ring-binding cell division protein DamX
MNWYIIIVVGIAVLALLIFFIRRNIKDESDFEKQLKDDYPHPKHDKADVDTEESPH